MKKANNLEGIKPYKWKKGVTGNPRGRPKNIPGINVLLGQVFAEDERRSILLALKKKALGGDMRAIEVILDRLYGKVKQQTEVSGLMGVKAITGMLINSDDTKDKTSIEADTSR